jgi:hypothetical protein
MAEQLQKSEQLENMFWNPVFLLMFCKAIVWDQ